MAEFVAPVEPQELLQRFMAMMDDFEQRPGLYEGADGFAVLASYVNQLLMWMAATAETH